MPSTTSSTVSADFDSSTVMTPSLPTFSMASAIRLPMVLSLLEAMVATCAISFLSLVDLDILLSSSTTASTAASIPRLRPIGLAPAVTFLSPSRTMAWARTVAVVVPSPAMSEVLEATSLSIWAPMSSQLSLSSISLATVTPSLVMVGLPNFLSMTTLRPFGPMVALTADAMMLTPRSRAARPSSLNRICFGIWCSSSIARWNDPAVGPGRVGAGRGYSIMANTSSSFMIRYSWSSTFTSEPEYFPNRMRSWAFTSRAIFLPSSFTFPLPTAMTLPSWGFSLAVSGMMMPPFLTSFSSSRLTRMRSCNGRIFMVGSPPMVRGGTWWLIPIRGVPSRRNVAAYDLAAPRRPAATRCCAIAGERQSDALLRGSGLEECRCADLCHRSIGVRLPRERRPSGFHHEFCLFPGRRDGRELAELLGPGHIGLLPGETDRDQRRSDRGISLLQRHLECRAARRPASPTEPHDHGENATDDNTPDPWFEPRALHLHGAPPGTSEKV